MEQFLIDYLTNAIWQIVLLAAGAWLLIRLGKFGPRTQHGIWVAVLALAVGLPFRGVRAQLSPGTQTACSDCSMDASAMNARQALPRAAIVTQLVVADPQLLKEFFTLPRPALRLSPTATNWLIGFYFATFFFGMYRIVAAWRRARELVRDADPTVLPPQWNAIFQESGRCLATRLPQLRKSADVRSPVIVGIKHPVLLLPEDFDSHSQNEVQAALFHELAHVRRHDYLGNLLCRVAALPVGWHPVIYGVQQRIRRTREMVCDDIAAGAMRSEIGYAKCLLAIAARTVGAHDYPHAAQAMGLLGDDALEERIMRLMQEKNTMTMHAKLARIASGATAMILAIAMAASFHVTPTLAQTSGTAVTVPAPPAPPTPPAPDIAVPPPPPAATDSVTPTPPAPHPAPSVSDMEVSAPPAIPDAAVTPVVPVTPVAPVAPRVPVDANPSPQKSKAVHPQPKKAKHQSFVIGGNDKSFGVDVNEDHALSKQQQAWVQKDIAAMDAQIAEATKRINSPEFKRQMAEIAKQQADLKHLDFAQMQRQIDAATAKINSPEFRQKMEDLQKQIQSDALQRGMQKAREQMKIAEQKQNAMQKLDIAKVQQQIDAATAKINSPEFKEKMENLQKQIESGAMQRSMEEASKQLKAAEDQMRQVQTK